MLVTAQLMVSYARAVVDPFLPRPLPYPLTPIPTSLHRSPRHCSYLGLVSLMVLCTFFFPHIPLFAFTANSDSHSALVYEYFGSVEVPISV